MSEQKIVSITNRNNGFTGYTLRDSNIWRNFAPGETKRVPLEELQQLSYQPGGDNILKNYFIINDKDALTILNMEDVEPEYFYTEAEVRKVLSEGTLDQLEDMLNFAPEGVIELAKKIAVDTELPDTRKRKMISEKTGFNIDNAINVNTIMNAEELTEEASTEGKKTRKAAPLTTEAGAKVRKATTPAVDKYKIVSK